MMTRSVLMILLAVLFFGAARLRASEVAASTGELLAMTPAMIEFVEAHVRKSPDATETIESLLQAIVGERGLALDYADTSTRTAAATFEARNGNCLSFTVLFVAMARQLGLDARFAEVMEVMSWGRQGNVVWSSRHMIAEVSTSSGLAQVDFLPELEKRYRSRRRIDDQRALAHYYNNLGAALLALGNTERSLDFFHRAREMDETFTPAWVNQGVALRRVGRTEESEKSYKRALEIDPREMTAASNLALLYDAIGRSKDAEPYMKMVRRYRRQNPFYHFSLGLRASREGDARAAVEHLQRAVRRQRKDAAFRAELAAAYLDLGQTRRAKRSLKKALQNAEDDDQRRRYRSRLESMSAPSSD